MSRSITYAGILAVFSIFAILQLPMALVANSLLPEKIRLNGCEGTLWQGRASALGLGGMVLQQDIAWQLRLDGLLSGQLRWEIRGKFATEPSRLALVLSPTTITLRDVNVVLPLEPLLNQDSKLKPLRLGGMLKLSSAVFTPQQPSDVSIRMENLFSALVPATGSLGSTEIKLLTQTKQPATWAAQPREGALAISGNGTFDLKRNTASGKLVLKPDEKLAGSLRPILALLQQGTEGNYTLDVGR